MTRTAGILLLTGAFAALSMTATTASAGSKTFKFSETAELHAYLHDPHLHVTDGLSNYSDDLSAYGTPRPVEGAMRQVRGNTNDKPQFNLASLRAYFHGPSFRSPDGLTNYSQDYRIYDAPMHDARLARLAETRP